MNVILKDRSSKEKTNRSYVFKSSTCWPQFSLYTQTHHTRAKRPCILCFNTDTVWKIPPWMQKFKSSVSASGGIGDDPYRSVRCTSEAQEAPHRKMRKDNKKWKKNTTWCLWVNTQYSKSKSVFTEGHWAPQSSGHKPSSRTLIQNDCQSSLTPSGPSMFKQQPLWFQW